MTITQWFTEWKLRRETWNECQKNTIIAWSHRGVLMLIVVSIVVLLWRLSSLPPMVPFWYSRPWGEEQLAHPYWLFLLPATGILWHIINICVSLSISRDYLTFTQLLYVTSLLVNALGLLTIINILILVS